MAVRKNLLRVLPASGLLIFLLPFSQAPLFWTSIGMPWMTLAVSLLVIPLIDQLIGSREPNPFAGTPMWLARWVPRLFVALQAALLWCALRLAPTLTGVELLWLGVGVGTITGGIGITVAHELGHRASRFDRALARALLVSVCYGHFQVEHIRGHHLRVATPEDRASAPAGMHVCRFLLRSVSGSFVHALALERLRLRARARGIWSAGNWVLPGTLLSLALALLAWLPAGAAGVALFVMQAFWAIALLETINYIEHYGLRRKRVGMRYEPVGPQHAWNTRCVLSNWLLFSLQLHPDHHLRMQRLYEALRAQSASPQLPAGYPALVVAALMPPLWFALIDPLVPQS